MLKLMKYEFIHSMRSFMISLCVFLGACILLPFFSEKTMSGIPILNFIVTFGFTVLIMGICLALFISIFTHYYHSMFKKPAYLTLTLPVSSIQLIISKIIITFLWIFIAVFVLFIGLVLMGLVSVLLSNNAVLYFNGLPEFIDVIFSYIFEHPLEITKIFITMFIEIYSLIIFVYFSLTVVHTKLCRHHRVVFGICIWIFLAIGYSYLINNVIGVGYNINFINLNMNIPIMYYIVSILCSVILTMLTVYILDHHIEIE